MDTKLYDLTLEVREKYFYACVQAQEIDVEIAVKYINELMAHLREAKHKKVVFVRETPSVGSRGHNAMIASIIVNMLPADVQFAMVDRSPTHEIVKQCLLEERERKQRNIYSFDDFEDAEAWILSHQDDTDAETEARTDEGPEDDPDENTITVSISPVTA